MTVIAWDGSIIAADKQASREGLKRTTKKLFVYGNSILGICGTEETGIMLLDWFIAGEKKDDWPKSQKDKDYWSHLIIVHYYEGARFYSLYPVSVEILNPFFAWGSGQDIAIGAMAAGANAIEAVEITCEYSEACGCGTDAYDIKTLKQI